VAALDRHQLTNQTLIVFLSDNGPFLSYGNHAGSAGKFREGKLTSFEGGVRTPCIACWPSRIPAGSHNHQMAATIDLLPTLALLTGGKLGPNKIDGKDISSLILGEPDARSPHEALFFYSGEELQAVRSGRWKLHLEHDYLTVPAVPGRDGKPAVVPNAQPASIQQSGIRGIATRHGYQVAHLPLSLFDLEADPGESQNLAEAHPDQVSRLMELARSMRLALGDSLLGQRGQEIRPAGKTSSSR
jgi:arylsulfatase